MAEDFTTAEMVIPGTYIRVSAEGLIGAGAVSTGNIGIVGTTPKGAGDTLTLSQYSDAAGPNGAFGDYDPFKNGAGKNNLSRALEVMYGNGALTVFARGVKVTATAADYVPEFLELLKEDVNILVAPELSTADAKTVLGQVLTAAGTNHRDVMVVIGCDGAKPDDIAAQVAPDDDGRIVFVAPGIVAIDAADSRAQNQTVKATLPATYTAGAVAGLLSTLVPQSSPTNKSMSGLSQLATRFTYSEAVELVKGGVLVLEERLGVRVVRGITAQMASNGPFRQITTRRIVDLAKAGIRLVADPFIGRLNNGRVRKALQGAIDGFLTSMLVDEALTGYQLQVTATRDDEINGRAIVNVLLQPTFSIDFVAVTLVLQ